MVTDAGHAVNKRCRYFSWHRSVLSRKKLRALRRREIVRASAFHGEHDDEGRMIMHASLAASAEDGDVVVVLMFKLMSDGIILCPYTIMSMIMRQAFFSD